MPGTTLTLNDGRGSDISQSALASSASHTPRRFGLPPSEPIANDTQEAEVYSLSVTHQLHCLAVLREVIKYEKGDNSRFAGNGHEYHCLDYIRQAILCAGDTTLDSSARMGK